MDIKSTILRVLIVLGLFAAFDASAQLKCTSGKTYLEIEQHPAAPLSPPTLMLKHPAKVYGQADTDIDFLAGAGSPKRIKSLALHLGPSSLGVHSPPSTKVSAPSTGLLPCTLLLRDGGTIVKKHGRVAALTFKAGQNYAVKAVATDGAGRTSTLSIDYRVLQVTASAPLGVVTWNSVNAARVELFAYSKTTGVGKIGNEFGPSGQLDVSQTGSGQSVIDAVWVVALSPNYIGSAVLNNCPAVTADLTCQSVDIPPPSTPPNGTTPVVPPGYALLDYRISFSDQNCSSGTKLGIAVFQGTAQSATAQDFTLLLERPYACPMNGELAASYGGVVKAGFYKIVATDPVGGTGNCKLVCLPAYHGSEQGLSLQTIDVNENNPSCQVPGEQSDISASCITQ
jgi:hypothetical protein